MNVALVGMNHKTAPVELRECIVPPEEGPTQVLARISEIHTVGEALFLSTCNRVEALLAAESPEAAVRDVTAFFLAHPEARSKDAADFLYILNGREAVCHLFRVAAGLDSMVIGEPQILGQLKEAYRVGLGGGFCGVILNRLLHKAFSVAKRVRTETGIGTAAVSISYAAVELAKKIFGDLSAKKVLLIGAGEMAELAVRHLAANGVREILVANRTYERAMELAKQFHGAAVSMQEIEERLKEVDMVISSTGAPGYVVSHKQVHGLMRRRKNRPLFFIDIAVPRDIDPRINDMPNTYVYDIDELQGVVELNLQERKREAVKAERIVEEEAVKFERWLSTLDAVPTIKELFERAEEIRRAEIRKTMPRLASLTPEQIRDIEAMSHAMVKKLLHHPVAFLKEPRRHEENRQRDLIFVRRLFNLDDPDQDTLIDAS